MMAYVVSDGRVFALKPSEWSMLLVGVALCVAAVSVISGWAQWIVLGAIIATVVGFMIAISPNRKGW